MAEFLEIFAWSDDFATGIFEIDEQHKMLVHLLNRLANSVARNDSAADLDKVFQELADYAVIHFQTEEGIWGETLAGDPMEKLHKAQHAAFLSDMASLKDEEGSKPQRAVFEDVLTVLTKWLMYHILESDKRLAAIVLAMKSGRSLEAARNLALNNLPSASDVMVETVLNMYGMLSKRTVQLSQEIAERRKAEERAKALYMRNQLLMQSTHEGIHILDEQGRVLEANDAFCQHLGYSRDEILRLGVFDFETKLPAEFIRASLGGAHAGHMSFESVHKRKDGSLVDVEVFVSGIELDGKKRFLALSRDISERKQTEADIKRLAFNDPLTRLPNRRLLVDRLEQAIAASKRSGLYGALLFLDLDNFKPFNDAYGHQAGDLLLIETARRLTLCVRDTDTVSRFGGDEFVVMLTALNVDQGTAAAQAKNVAKKIRASLSAPYTIALQGAQSDEKTIDHLCSVSIGIALFPQSRCGAEDVIRFADLAMYKAKSAGSNLIRLQA